MFDPAEARPRSAERRHRRPDARRQARRGRRTGAAHRAVRARTLRSRRTTPRARSPPRPAPTLFAACPNTTVLEYAFGETPLAVGARGGSRARRRRTAPPRRPSGSRGRARPHPSQHPRPVVRSRLGVPDVPSTIVRPIASRRRSPSTAAARLRASALPAASPPSTRPSRRLARAGPRRHPDDRAERRHRALDVPVAEQPELLDHPDGLQHPDRLRPRDARAPAASWPPAGRLADDGTSITLQLREGVTLPLRPRVHRRRRHLHHPGDAARGRLLPAQARRAGHRRHDGRRRPHRDAAPGAPGVEPVRHVRGDADRRQGHLRRPARGQAVRRHRAVQGGQATRPAPASSSSGTTTTGCKDRPYLDGIDISVQSQSQSMLSSLQVRREPARPRHGPARRGVGQGRPAVRRDRVRRRRLRLLRRLQRRRSRRWTSPRCGRASPGRSTGTASSTRRSAGSARPARCPWSPSSPAYDEDKAATYTRDLDKAKELIDQAGATGRAGQGRLQRRASRPTRRSPRSCSSTSRRPGLKAELVPLQAPDFFSQARPAAACRACSSTSTASASSRRPPLVKGAFPFNADKNASGFDSDEYRELAQDAVDVRGRRRHATTTPLNDFLLDQQFVSDLVVSSHTFTISSKLHGRRLQHVRLPRPRRRLPDEVTVSRGNDVQRGVTVLRYAVRRVPSAVVVLLVASVIVFIVPRLAEGDAADVLAGPDASDATRDAVRPDLGLDRSPVVQYAASGCAGLLTGDLGTSYIRKQPASEAIGAALGQTVTLTVGRAARRAGARRRSRASSMGAGRNRVADPGGQRVWSRWRSRSRRTSAGCCWSCCSRSPSGCSRPSGYQADLRRPRRSRCSTSLMPALCLGLPAAAVIARFLGASVRQVLDEEFVRTGVAKGLTRGAAGAGARRPQRPAAGADHPRHPGRAAARRRDRGRGDLRLARHRRPARELRPQPRLRPRPGPAALHGGGLRRRADSSPTWPTRPSTRASDWRSDDRDRRPRDPRRRAPAAVARRAVPLGARRCATPRPSPGSSSSCPLRGRHPRAVAGAVRRGRAEQQQLRRRERAAPARHRRVRPRRVQPGAVRHPAGRRRRRARRPARRDPRHRPRAAVRTAPRRSTPSSSAPST